MTLGRTVTVVNRVVNASGEPVPYTAYVDGQAITIRDRVQLPEGVARIVVHHSMYCLDPDTYQAQYRLGVPEWDMPTDPLPLEVVQRPELINREALPPHRQLGALDPKTGRRLGLFHQRVPIRRHDPIAVVAPGPREDGAFPGGYGDAFAR